MIQIYMACTVWGEPLCQTAQSFMPELLYGVNRSLTKVNVPHSQFSNHKAFIFYRLKIFGFSFGRVVLLPIRIADSLLYIQKF